MDSVELEPFTHQAGGCSSMMRLDETTICKTLNSREQHFYLNMPRDLKEFTPEYKGVIEVNLQKDSNGYISCIGYPMYILDHQESQVSSFRSSPKSSNKDQDIPVLQSDERKVDSDQDRNKSEEVCTQTHNPWSGKCLERLISKMKNEENNRTTCKFILLENVVAKFKKPCVLDIKMGTRQHGDHTKEEIKQRYIQKCRTSTSSTIGIRLGGLQGLPVCSV
ncbi:inositol hexakisphosphate kinase 1-like isoform X2 [Mytilus galloprovincialis]|uniref:inositol hexakisphosphate kinase 1-like isoform X2 n=1 Tax=Mytilus galloprovincialis TaxID=29158 RepID=UPI003F7CBFA8